jgi:hypothetical protein
MQPKRRRGDAAIDLQRRLRDAMDKFNHLGLGSVKKHEDLPGLRIQAFAFGEPLALDHLTLKNKSWRYLLEALTQAPRLEFLSLRTTDASKQKKKGLLQDADIVALPHLQTLKLNCPDMSTTRSLLAALPAPTDDLNITTQSPSQCEIYDLLSSVAPTGAQPAIKMTPMDRIHPTDGTDINVTAHWLPEIGVTPRLPVSVTTRLNKNNADAS